MEVLDESQGLQELLKEKEVPIPAYTRGPEGRLELTRNRTLSPRERASEDRNQIEVRRYRFPPKMQSRSEVAEESDELLIEQIERLPDGGLASLCK